MNILDMFTKFDNRKSRSKVRCLHCGRPALADANGAEVITAGLVVDWTWLRFAPANR